MYLRDRQGVELTRLAVAARVAAAGLTGYARAQAPRPAPSQAPVAVLRAEDGEIGCIVSRLPLTALTAALTSESVHGEGPDRLVVEVRAPAEAGAANLPKLSPTSRDFSTLPIEVYLLPAGYHSEPAGTRRRQVDAQVVDATLVRGTAEKPVFARVTFPREMLRPGTQIIGQRRAAASGGQEIVRQTRCRITEADAAAWR